MNELKSQGKSFEISKREVWEAFQEVKKNKGASGVDGQSIAEFEADLNRSYATLPTPCRGSERCWPAVSVVGRGV